MPIVHVSVTRLFTQLRQAGWLTRDRVVAGLRKVGWQVPEPQGNFVWFGLGDRTVEFAAAAEEAGIVVRPFAGDGARVSIGEPEANDRIIQVAAKFRDALDG